MADDTYAAVNGASVVRVLLTVSTSGPWIADVDFAADPKLPDDGAATLTIGDTLTMVGTVVARSVGRFGLQTRARIVAGKGGWGRELSPQQYHNDAGVKARTVADDAATAVGETIGDFLPSGERVGRDYVRVFGPASVALTDAAGKGVPWWVDAAGVTHVGPRPAVALPRGSYTLISHDAREQVATLAMDDPSLLQVGSILTDERLDAALTVRSYTLRLEASELRIHAQCGGADSGLGRLASLVSSLIARAGEQRLYGLYRYRVIKMSGRRVELQAVRQAAGLPDLLPLSVWPGVAGAVAQLAPGAEVLVSFVEGDKTQPIVTGFAGADGPGFVPVSLTLGGESGAPAARMGDIVECQLPPAAFTGSVGGAPATGVLTFTPAKALGIITSGSSRVKVAT